MGNYGKRRSISRYDPRQTPFFIVFLAICPGIVESRNFISKPLQQLGSGLTTHAGQKCEYLSENFFSISNQHAIDNAFLVPVRAYLSVKDGTDE